MNKRELTLAATLVVCLRPLGGGAESETLGPLIIRWSAAGSSEQASIEVDGILPEDLAALSTVPPESKEWLEVLRISVHETETPDLPAVLGSYEVHGSVLRFTPRFPFDPGRPYRAVLQIGRAGGRAGDAAPVVAILSLPARESLPATVVQHVYPSTQRVPENLLKLYIHFSAPMRLGDGLPFIRLYDEGGNEVTDPFLPLGAEFWDRDRRRYTVIFDPGRVKQGILSHEELGRPLRQGQRYSLVIDPQWRDAEGNPLRAPYRKVLEAGPPDESPIDPAAWQILSPTAGSRDPLTVRFPEPLDAALLESALGVETADGRSLAGEAGTSDQETLWTFKPHEPWVAGTYQLFALSILEDLAGNRIGQRFEVDLFEEVEPSREDQKHRVDFVVRER